MSKCIFWGPGGGRPFWEGKIYGKPKVFEIGSPGLVFWYTFFHRTHWSVEKLLVSAHLLHLYVSQCDTNWPFTPFAAEHHCKMCSKSYMNYTTGNRDHAHDCASVAHKYINNTQSAQDNACAQRHSLELFKQHIQWYQPPLPPIQCQNKLFESVGGCVRSHSKYSLCNHFVILKVWAVWAGTFFPRTFQAKSWEHFLWTFALWRRALQ